MNEEEFQDIFDNAVSSTQYSMTAEEEILQSRNQTMQEAANSRPVNTTKTYRAGTQEFLKYCSEKRFVDGNTVTGKLFDAFDFCSHLLLLLKKLC
jgi:hypothetical protein